MTGLTSALKTELANTTHPYVGLGDAFVNALAPKIGTP